MSLSFPQLQALAAKAGFADPVTAAAIAMAESSGNPNAIGDNGTSYGLWQIHVPAWPQFAANPQALLNPATNAAAAAMVYNAQGWTAWSTYNNLAYTQYMPAAAATTQNAAPAPLTIDNATGLPVTDNTPTPDQVAAGVGLPPTIFGFDTGTVLVGAAVALGLWWVLGELEG
jgi:hypothetical protein